MTDRQIKLILGSLLHDIGKVVYRSGDGRNHSLSGYEYLKSTAQIGDKDILDCVRFHHGFYLKNASLEKDSLAYITYFADNIAAAADRRESQEQGEGFDRKVPLSSVFNILNGNQGTSHYRRQVLNVSEEINYPTDVPVTMDESFYQGIIANITDNLRGIGFEKEYVHSLLSVLEANLTYIPSSTSKRELSDISLYDHLKVTAAVASCAEQYVGKDCDYRETFYEKAVRSYEEKMFLLYSMDISGIQDFIYMVGSKGALRGLRARSFYLEIMMEHIIDELLEELSLSRANLIYSGGGHCYLLLPNTETVMQIVSEQEKKVNAWFLKTFGTALFLAGGYAACSANELKNVPQGSYADLYRSVSRMISEKKLHRYHAQEIRLLNQKEQDGDRECSVCLQMRTLDAEGRCPICASLERMSGSILYEDYFTVVTSKEPDSLPLPDEKYLVADDERKLRERMEQDTYVRSYTKNNMYTGKYVSTKLWVGDYTTGDTFELFSRKAAGIERIGILRADVDNLGKTFVSGFSEQYNTLSRTAALSRQLSLFFKCYINRIMEKGTERRLEASEKRNVTIVYSGGDDIFLTGAWNDVLSAFIDLKKAFTRFTQGTLTISGGVGMYPAKYPVNIMAEEVAGLEETAKESDGKDGIVLFDRHENYKWDIFLKNILGEKFAAIKEYFDVTQLHGVTFLYHLTELLRGESERINRARFVYFLSRMEPDENSEQEQRRAYREFSGRMYQWSRKADDRRELVMAIYLYVYLHREKEEA